ncbi:hypothetical protein [Conexibacter sp. CPCC 206217]|uniref:hypothetical protein n=1 Tax=Conexibacter sp. CPCC 206217 TaxID=3064574 RepID=UPI002727E2BC|nr:hypothetical protein [Conexibacter sp. CPCC 206217]MDO8210882.1 hypothetical protein [Conexibacter sp. CPCC 206217]
MPTDSDMPESWDKNARGRSAEITAAIERAREVRAGKAPKAAPVDELAQRRVARLAADEARRRLRPTDPPGPRTA